MITLTAKQNSLLSQQIETERAILKRLRISYPEPRQSTHPFPAKTKHTALPSNRIYVRSCEHVKALTLPHLHITPSATKTHHFPSKSDLGALSSTTLESHMRSARNASLMITSQDRQNTPLHRKFQSGRAIFKGFRISYAERKLCSANDHFTGRTKHSTPPRNPIRARYLQ